MIPAAFDYHSPATLDEALALLTQHGDKAKILAGGQSLLPMLKLRLGQAGVLIDIGRVPGLDYIKEEAGTLKIGAATRESALERSELIRSKYPILLDTATVIARGPKGERTIPIGEFFTGIFSTALAPNEILTEIRIPIPPPRSGGAYRKLERKVGDFATAAAAVQLTLGAGGEVAQVGIGLTAMGDVPVKATDAGRFLKGKKTNGAAITEASQ